jgi:DNA-directed RNA polymerase specialized sigma24 family protein
MRRVRRYAGRAELARYQRIIGVYAPYVLIRCAAFTNSRRLSQEIGAYVLICTCLMSSKLDHSRQLGILVEVMLETVGPDVTSRGQGEGDEPLLVDRRTRTLVNALNRLDRPLREVLILHSIGGRNIRELASLLQKPPAEIEANLASAEEALAQDLELADVVDAQTLLAEYTANQDVDWILEVACAATAYLAGEVEQAAPLPRCWLN